MKRLETFGVLQVVARGKYKGNASTYILHGARGTHFFKSISEEENNSQAEKEERITQLTLHELGSCKINSQSEPALSSTEVYQYPNSCNSVALNTNMRCVPLVNLLEDLPDIEPDEDWTNPTSDLLERLQNAPISTSVRSWKTRHRERLGQQFVTQLWTHCQKQKLIGGEYRYPIHPEVFPLVEALQRAVDEERSSDVEELNQQIRELCFGADGRLSSRFKYLWQPPKETRRKCPACEARGRKRTLRLVMLTSAHGAVFGAIRMRCTAKDCHYIGDVWKEFPVFGKPPQSAEQKCG